MRTKVAQATLMQPLAIRHLDEGADCKTIYRRGIWRTCFSPNTKGDGAEVWPKCLWLLKQSGTWHLGIPKPTLGYLWTSAGFSVAYKQLHLQLLSILFTLRWRTHSSCFIVLYSDAALHAQLLSSSWVAYPLLNTRKQQYFTTNKVIKFPVSLLSPPFYRGGAKTQAW